MKILKKTLHIGGMSCVNCEHKIKYVLKTTPGITEVDVSYNTGLAHITYDTDTISLKQIREIIEKTGYTILPETDTSNYNKKKTFISLAVILLLYALLQHLWHSQSSGTRTIGRYKNGLWHVICNRTHHICTLYCHVWRHQPVPVYPFSF